MLFEYVMLAGVNDTDADAARLAALAADIEAKFNLITFNPHAGTRFAPSPPERARARTVHRGPAGRSLAAGALLGPRCVGAAERMALRRLPMCLHLKCAGAAPRTPVQAHVLMWRRCCGSTPARSQPDAQSIRANAPSC